MTKFNNYSLVLIGMYILSFTVMEYGASNWVRIAPEITSVSCAKVDTLLARSDLKKAQVYRGPLSIFSDPNAPRGCSYLMQETEVISGAILNGLFSLPVIIFIVLWSEKISGYLTNRSNQSLSTIFYTDIFIINYSFILALITSLVFQRSNVDARGWWPIAIILGEFFGLLSGLAFSILALMLHKYHNRYTNGFAIAIFVGYIIFSLLPWRYVHSGPVDLFTSYILLLFIFHLINCLYQQFKKSR